MSARPEGLCQCVLATTHDGSCSAEMSAATKARSYHRAGLLGLEERLSSEKVWIPALTEKIRGSPLTMLVRKYFVRSIEPLTSENTQSLPWREFWAPKARLLHGAALPQELVYFSSCVTAWFMRWRRRRCRPVSRNRRLNFSPQNVSTPNLCMPKVQR